MGDGATLPHPSGAAGHRGRRTRCSASGIRRAPSTCRARLPSRHPQQRPRSARPIWRGYGASMRSQQRTPSRRGGQRQASRGYSSPTRRGVNGSGTGTASTRRRAGARTRPVRCWAYRCRAGRCLPRPQPLSSHPHRLRLGPATPCPLSCRRRASGARSRPQRRPGARRTAGTSASHPARICCATSAWSQNQTTPTPPAAASQRCTSRRPICGSTWGQRRWLSRTSRCPSGTRSRSLPHV